MITNNFDRGDYVITVFLDLAKVFDSNSRRILIRETRNILSKE